MNREASKLPITVLMKEHRLIERAIDLLEKEMQKIKETSEIDNTKIDLFVDFFRTYTDRNHHGKEEDILFKKLDDKSLFVEHRDSMEDLINEHEAAREKVAQLNSAAQQYATGDLESLDVIIKIISELIDFYPKHINKEDQEFFGPSMDYFSDEELDEMMKEFEEFDKSMLHEKYEAIIKNLEG